MEKNAILFHVMVPVYTVEAYLDECVRSVLEQTYQNFELILVDDGSPDRCGELCDAWAERDSRIRVYHKSNGGLMHARRFGIARVHERRAMTDADYAVFLDSDDALEPHTLQTIAETIAAYDCDCVFYNFKTFGLGITPQIGDTMADRPYLVTDKKELYDRMLCGAAGFNSLCRKAVRMDLLSADMGKYAPYYHISWGEDRLQSLEIYQNCKRVCMIPDALYRYRTNAESLTYGLNYQKFLTNCDLYQAERELLEQDACYSEALYGRYRNLRIHHFTGDLVKIARLPLPRRERIEVYRKLKESVYWKSFLDGEKYDRSALGKIFVVYEAFRRDWYDVIFLLASIYRGSSQ